MEQPDHGRCIAEFSGRCHEPVARYLENLSNESGGLSMCNKYQILNHNLFPFGPSLLFFIKHKENIHLWCHMLDWIHLNSKVT